MLGLGSLSYLLVLCGALLIVVPLRMLIAGLRGRPDTEPKDRETVLFGMLVLWIVPLAAGVALGTGGGPRQIGLLQTVAILLGIVPGEQPIWLWLGRLAILVFAGCLFALTRLDKKPAAPPDQAG